MSVTKGMLASSMTSRIAGERARTKGLAMRRCVVNVRVEEVVCICCGRCSSRRAVTRDRINGMMANSRRLSKTMSDNQDINEQVLTPQFHPRSVRCLRPT